MIFTSLSLFAGERQALARHEEAAQSARIFTLEITLGNVRCRIVALSSV
jgi:hypothetical protein